MEEAERDFFEQFMQRHVEVTGAQIDAMQRGFAEMERNLAAMRAEMRRGFDLLQAEVADQREQIQANTRALLSVLDRFEGN